MSWLHGRWLKQQAEASGAAVIASRPWQTLFERVLRAVTIEIQASIDADLKDAKALLEELNNSR